MSQSATFYRITPNVFHVMSQDPENFILDNNNCMGSETFVSTHEGLQYILTRGSKDKKLMRQVFNPSTQIGEVDLEKEDLDIEDFEKIISYLPSDKISEINLVLEELNKKFFKDNFKPEEMNEAEVYPYDVWGEGAFSYQEVYKDFVRLKSLFNTAAREGSYLLYYVG